MMIKKFLDNFTAPEKGKVSDKVMTYNIIACVIGVLLCVVSLTAATWAWFGDTISSPSNTVQTGVYSLDVTVSDDTGLLTPDDSGYYELVGGVEYTVTLASTKSSNVSTGYCAVDFVSDDSDVDAEGAPIDIKYYSVQIFTEVSGESPTSITFTLTLSKTDKVNFEAWWGTHVVEDDETYFASGNAYTYDPADKLQAVAQGSTVTE